MQSILSESGVVTVPVIPASLCTQVLEMYHDVASAGHQGVAKTLNRVRSKAYWVNMGQDVVNYCRQCVKCQQSKPTMPVRAPMVSIPIGRP